MHRLVVGLSVCVSVCCVSVCVCVFPMGDKCVATGPPRGQSARTGACGAAVVTQGNGDFKARQTGWQNRGPYGAGSVNRAVCVCVCVCVSTQRVWAEGTLATSKTTRLRCPGRPFLNRRL